MHVFIFRGRNGMCKEYYDGIFIWNSISQFLGTSWTFYRVDEIVKYYKLAHSVLLIYFRYFSDTAAARVFWNVFC